MAKNDQDINSIISDDAVMLDALVMKNKVLLVQNAQFMARVRALEEALDEIKNLKPKKRKAKK
jgi:hypothetical protein